METYLFCRKKRALGDNFDLLAALGLRNKAPKQAKHGLEGISNEHLEQILKAGVPNKEPNIDINLIAKVSFKNVSKY